MSFWSGLTSMVSGVTSFFSGNSLGSTVLKTAISGIGLHLVNRSVTAANRQNSSRDTDSLPPRSESPIVNRQQVDADQSNKIPVVYGHAQLSGIITDAHMSNFNTRMTLVYTLSELTGDKLSDNQPSVFTFNNIYYNDERLVFKTSGAQAGIEVDHSLDRDGNRNDSYNGLVRVFCYRGNSSAPVAPVGYTNAAIPLAYSVVPTWTTDHVMTDLIFAVVEVDYSIDKGSTMVGNFRFDINNSMTLPGDCMLDYMTNSRYGAGIPREDIFDE
jgi:hypothetical protein